MNVPKSDPGTATKAREVNGVDGGGVAEGGEVVSEEGEARPHPVHHHQRDGRGLARVATYNRL